jgi:tetratricopeptide (TPR) repeat protein
MKVKPPPVRRKFANEWDEIGYLYDKLLYWLYQREDVGKARRYAERLERLLRKADPEHKSIFGEECRSLVHETQGDLQKATERRKNEIRLIRRLHEISRNAPSENLLLRDYGYDALSDRLDLLATLYHDTGQLDKAINALEESKQLCQTHGIPFDGEDLLQEYLGEKLQAHAEKGARPGKVG